MTHSSILEYFFSRSADKLLNQQQQIVRTAAATIKHVEKTTKELIRRIIFRYRMSTFSLHELCQTCQKLASVYQVKYRTLSGSFSGILSKK